MGTQEIEFSEEFKKDFFGGRFSVIYDPNTDRLYDRDHNDITDDDQAIANLIRDFAREKYG